MQIMGLGDVAKFTHQVLRAGKGKARGHYGFHPWVLDIIKEIREENVEIMNMSHIPQQGFCGFNSEGKPQFQGDRGSRFQKKQFMS